MTEETKPLTPNEQRIKLTVDGYADAGPEFLAQRLLTTIFSSLEDPEAVAVHNVFVAELLSMIPPDKFEDVLVDVAKVFQLNALIIARAVDDSSS